MATTVHRHADGSLELRRDGKSEAVWLAADGIVRMSNAEGGLELGPTGLRLWTRDASVVFAGDKATLSGPDPAAPAA